MQSPQLSVVLLLYPERITVWCAISSKRIIGPIFIDNMVIGVKYRKLVEHHFDPEVSRLNLTSRYLFMQDGARLNRTADVLTWLEATFGECLIV